MATEIRLDEFCNCLHTRRKHASGGTGHCMFYDGMPCPCSAFRFPNFRQSTQSEAASSGVEGAHESTTADKSEPEKLNNAHDREFLESLLDTLRNSAKRFERKGMSREEVNHQILELESRLAESSQSSPPPINPYKYAFEFVRDYLGLPKESTNDGEDLKKLLPIMRDAIRAASPELLPTQLPKEK